MTQVLERAFEAASNLPERDQEFLAARILADVEDEKRWNESFARSHHVLDKLAEEALAEFRAGETEEGDW